MRAMMGEGGTTAQCGASQVGQAAANVEGPGTRQLAGSCRELEPHGCGGLIAWGQTTSNKQGGQAWNLACRLNLHAPGCWRHCGSTVPLGLCLLWARARFGSGVGVRYVCAAVWAPEHRLRGVGRGGGPARACGWGRMGWG